MIEFNDIDFYGHGPMPHHHHHEGHCGPQMPPPPPMPPFDPELKRVFDLAAHADRVAHKALDVAGFASLDAASAKKLAEQTLSVLNKVSMVADKANVKADRALSEIDLLKDDVTALLNELNATQSGAGLATDGSYIQNESANYISEATSLADADNKLDAKLKEVDSAVSNLDSDLQDLEDAIASLSERLGDAEALSTTIINAVGLESDGKYTRMTNTIVQPGRTLKSAVEYLAEEVLTLGDTVTSFNVAGLQEQVDTNTADIVTLKNKDVELQNSIDALNTTVGTIQNSDTRQNRRIGDLENKVDSLNLVRRGDGLSYDLMLGEEVLGTVVIPEDKYVSNVSYDNVNKKIIFTYADNNMVQVPVSDLVDTYTAGSGISVNNNTISISIDPESELGIASSGTGFLSVGPNGLAINGIINEIDRAYVAGEGLDRSESRNNEGEWVFKVKIAQNSTDYLKANTDGLELNIDALRNAIGGGGSEIDPADLAGKGLVVNNNKLDVNVGDGLRIDSADNKVKVSLGRGLTINNNGQIEIDETYLSNLINNLIDAKLLWQVKDGQANAIEPKPQYTEVHVSGAIYSGQD